MEQYTCLPLLYDRLMEDVDHSAWCAYLLALMSKEGEQREVKNILELGCGSGNITRELLAEGYEVVGIDSSFEMLEIARKKTEIYGEKIILLEQDIREMDFDIYEIDCVLAVNDTFNYILEEEELLSIFSFIFERLRDGGIFLFDVSSPFKLSQILGNNTFGESFEDSCYLWENFYEEEEALLTMELNLFLKTERGVYERREETHFQRAHPPEKLKEMLEEAGFSKMRIYSDFSEEEKDSGELGEAERIFFCCIKQR